MKGVRRYVSPVFLTMLFVSFLAWYLIKLGHTYTAEIPVTVDVAGNRFVVECVAEGRGYRLVAHRWFPRYPVVLGLKDVQTTPSAVNEGMYEINPLSLQSAISIRNEDVRIISIGEIPEIRLSEKP